MQSYWGLQEFLLEVLDHIDGHLVEVVVGFPAPLVAGAGVVHLVGPGVGDLLTDGVELVFHLEVGIVLLDSVEDDFGVEAHSRDVEAVAVDELAGVSFHDVDHGLLSVGHIHHVHVGAFCDGADELLALDGCVVDLDSVVRGAAAGEGEVADEAGEADGTGIHAETGEVVVAQQFAGNLGDAVDGVRTLDSVLRGVVAGGGGAEGSDAGGGEDGAAEEASHLEAVDEGADADVPAEHGVELSGSAEDGGEVVDGVDVVFLHSFGNLHDLGGVDALDGAALVVGTFEGTEVGADDVVVAVDITQVACEFGADLSAGTYDKNIFHFM